MKRYLYHLRLWQTFYDEWRLTGMKDRNLWDLAEEQWELKEKEWETLRMEKYGRVY